MTEKHKNSEKGQAIVYLVLGIIVFLGFVALAIDGGMALADRRHIQNAADAASLAGGGEAAKILESAGFVCYANWSCNGGGFGNAGYAKAQSAQAAKDRADYNGFNLDNNLNRKNGVDVTCDDTSEEKYIDVTVNISETTQSNFLQLIFPSSLKNKLESVTRVHPMQPIGLDDAVIGLNPDNCSGQNGVTVGGTSDNIISGGDVFSNGCIRGDGNGTATVITGTVEGHILAPGNVTWNPAPQYTDDYVEPSDYYIEGPALDSNGDCIDAYNVQNNLPDFLDPGLWCVKGNVNINKDLEGYEVTIYMMGGNLVYNGNASVKLTATEDLDASPEIPGVVIFAPNGGSITLNGTSSDEFDGMIYAPKSDISLSGNAYNIFNGQVIGWNVKITGTNEMGVYYDECSGYVKPPFIELYR